MGDDAESDAVVVYGVARSLRRGGCRNGFGSLLAGGTPESAFGPTELCSRLPLYDAVHRRYGCFFAIPRQK